ncbi:MAG: hypothetical protein Q8O14_06185 [bacterium]|jgi:hypothetical protein|nr:hypothetical protein [bacterium]
MAHSTVLPSNSAHLVDTLRRFKMHKRTLEIRLKAVREERDDLRHLVNIPVNPRSRQQPLLDEEKDSRLVEIFAKVDEGQYFRRELAEQISERLMDRLWSITF